MSEPFFLPLDGPDGERFHATAATTGPWFATAQHAGPPTALLVRALERCAPQPGTEIGRIFIENSRHHAALIADAIARRPLVPA